MPRRNALLLTILLSASAAAGASPARPLLSGLDIGGVTALRAGTATTLRFDAVPADVEEMEVVLSLDGGATFPIRVTRRWSPATHEVEWRVPNLPSAHARLALRVGNDEDEETVQEVSAEFEILPDESLALERVERYRGEWWAGDALIEAPSTVPLPGFGRAHDSISAIAFDSDAEVPPQGLRACPRSAGAPQVIGAPSPEPASSPSLRPFQCRLPRRE